MRITALSTPGAASGGRSNRPATARFATRFTPWIAPFVDPAIFDFWAGHINPAWSWSRPLARVIARRVEALDTVTLVLAPNRHCARVQAGQHINIAAEVNGRRTTRSYSVSNAPGRNGRIEITVKRVEGGKLSNHLCRHTKTGDVLELGDVFGHMTTPTPAQGDWMFLAAGSGITPLMSLTRALVKHDMPVSLILIYWAKTRAELCFLAELQALEKAHPRFTLRVVLTDERDCLPHEAHGLISAQQLSELAGDWSDKNIYACGPAGFVQAARSVAAGSARSFSAEGFTPQKPATTQADGGATVRVELLKSGRTLDIPTGQPLLQALEAQGLKPEYGCRMGICQTCSCTKRSGTTLDMQSGETNAEPDSALRLCISRATSDLALNI